MADNPLRQLLGQKVHIEVDRPIGYLHHGYRYPVNYGYIPGMLGGDGEEQDAYILGVGEPLVSFEGIVVAVIHRKNDVEDKLVVAPEGMEFHQGQIAEVTHFQEQFFDIAIDSLFQKSCGVLPYRLQNGLQEFLLVYEHYSQCWSLPKGHMEAGETEAETALRELKEETGLTALLETAKTASIEYAISPVARKQVVFFLGRVEGEPQTRDGEIDGFRWVTAEEFPNYLFADTVVACRKILAFEQD